MKTIFFLTLSFVFSNTSLSQIDTMIFCYHKIDYQNYANKKMEIWYNANKDDASGTNAIFNNLSNLNSFSIPIFMLKKESITYNCGDDFLQYIDFQNNPNLQFMKIFDVLLQNKCYKNLIVSDFFSNDESNYFRTVSNFVHIKNKIVDRYIIQFAENHKEFVIFMIMDLEGYWGISNGNFYKLEKGLFRKIKPIKGNKGILEYGEDYIHDIGKQEGVTIGKKYKKCKKKGLKIKSKNYIDFQVH